MRVKLENDALKAAQADAMHKFGATMVEDCPIVGIQISEIEELPGNWENKSIKVTFNYQSGFCEQ